MASLELYIHPVQLDNQFGTEEAMAETVTYTNAREHLAEILDRIAADRVTVTITRRNGEKFVLLAEDDFSSLQETAYVLSSPANARRLMAALESSRAGQGESTTIEELREMVGARKSRGRK